VQSEFASWHIPSLWSGNLRLSLVLIPVRLIPAVSTEEAISFRQIHEPSGTPIRQVKGVRDGDTFTEVPDEEIIKGYEYAKRQSRPYRSEGD
jgi:DNA end-binding protein Ku